MAKKDGDREELERKLRAYFRQDSREAEPPPSMVERLLVRLGEQRRPPRLPAPPSDLFSGRWGRTFAALGATLVMVLVVLIAWGLLVWRADDFSIPAATPAPTLPAAGSNRSSMAPTPTPSPTDTPVPTPTPPPQGLPTPTPGTAPFPYDGDIWFRAGKVFFLQRGPVTNSSGSGVELQAGRAVFYEGTYGVLFYAVEGPAHLEGWRLEPKQVQVVGPGGTHYPVLQSQTLATTRRLSLNSLTFSLAEASPGVLRFQFDGFEAYSPEDEGSRPIPGLWSLEPVRGLQRQEGRPYAYWDGASEEEVCVVDGERSGIAFREDAYCQPFEAPPSPAAPPTSTPLPAASPGAAPTPTLALSPPTPTPSPVFLTFKLYTPRVQYLRVKVDGGGLVSVVGREIRR